MGEVGKNAMFEPWTDENQARFSIPACGRQVIKSMGYETLK
jgi:hypothetical protein